MKTLIIFSLFFLWSIATSTTARSAECVILLHGLARSDSSMKQLESALIESGYLAVNFDYPSTRHTIQTLSEEVITDALERCSGQERIHFVTHSLGGILVRYYLNGHEIDKLGRVVMLGPPNKGSHVVDTLHWVPGFELLNGPAGMQLGTGKNSLPNNLGPANFEVGIIAGTKTINLILSTMLPNPDDGKVSVEYTKLEGMTDHISLPVTHPFMMNDDEVIAQVLYFLKHGRFKKS